MNRYLKHIYILCALLLGAGFLVYLFFFYSISEGKEVVHHYHKTDSIIVQEIPKYIHNPNVQPINITIQQKLDTTLRKQAEKESILMNVKYDKGVLDLQEVDTAGKVTDKKFQLDPDSGFISNNKGVEEKKKTKAGKFLQKTGKGIKTGLAVIGGIAIILIATK
jgi:hypothetical protein